MTETKVGDFENYIPERTREDKLVETVSAMARDIEQLHAMMISLENRVNILEGGRDNV